MANEALNISFDNGLGTLGNAWNVDTSTNGEIKLAGNSAIMEWASGPSAGHGYGTYTVEAKLEGNEPGAAIIFWPGDDQWPGQELDLAEIAPDGSGQIYGTVHWNDNGHDAYSAQVYDGIYTGSFHEYTMVWEPGKITYLVDGETKAVFTDNVPKDFAHGGMNNTIGFLNNNPDTSITVRDVSYTPLGGAAALPEATDNGEAGQASNDDSDEVPSADDDTGVEVADSDTTDGGIDLDQDIVIDAAAGGTASHGGWDWPADANGLVDWHALAAQVQENYEQTGQWFI